jgi:L-gulono-1,4-lactone dehydrogenase
VLDFRTRTGWHNHRGHEAADPLRTYTPTSVEDVAAIVRQAEADGATVRAAGSGHSWSDAARPGGYLVRPDGMRSPLDLEAGLLRRPAERLATLVRVGAGMRVHELNDHLAARGQALVNMGGYDGQTVAGVVSTSTHGSGRDLGPLNDAVRSIDLVAAGGVMHRIEPDDGPTDADRWRSRYPEPANRIVQDDDVFAAAVVGIGCLGVICSLILEVRDAYVLTERRSGTTWERERDKIAGALAAHRHYELLLTPYVGRDGEHRCMVTTRHPHDGRRPRWWSSRSRRNLVAEAISGFPGAGRLMQAFAALLPGRMPAGLEWSLKRLVDDEYTGPSHRVLNIGAANFLPAVSMEIGVPVDAEGTHVEAMERVFAVADEFRGLGRVFHTAPIALRFVKDSPALLSMMHGRELTMMIELILLDGTFGGAELLAAYENALRPLGGRPHWGQVNHLTRAEIERLYGEAFDRWLDVHADLNRSGVFDGPFSHRVGIARRVA